jgi:hypothetical protein
MRIGRIRLTVVLVALGLGAAVPTAGAAPAPGRVSCKATSVTFLFWPAGHQAVASANFPAFPYPHVEVYRNGSYADADQLAGIGFGPSGQTYAGFVPSCAAAKAKSISTKAAVGTTQAATALTCTFPGAVQLESAASTSPISVTLRAIVPSSKKRVLSVAVSLQMLEPAGSTLRYDPKYCKAAPPPS